jgi:signal transduction histidine kinase
MLDSLRSTAAWRISSWTTVAFAVGSAAAFAIMYLLVANDFRERSDAWLSGEVDVLANVSETVPHDDLYDRMVKEVAEHASREVPNLPGGRGPRKNRVFFVLTRNGQEPLYVGPEPKEAFLRALDQADLQLGVPQPVQVTGWRLPFRVVYRARKGAGVIYLGFADEGAARMMRRLTQRFVQIWFGMVGLGFLISAVGAYRTLRRVERIAAAVARIGSEDLSGRLPEGPHRDEISRLSRTFNHMLERVQASVHQLRVLTDSVAHDMKSPVTSIRGNLEVALSHGDGQAWRESVADAIEKLDRLSETLNTSLDLAEAEAGALRLRREPVDLGGLVRQLIDLYQPAMAERQHDVICHLQEGVVVDGDPSLIGRAITNLLDNEVVHLPLGCRVSVALRASDEKASLAVEDDGPGFPAGLKARAFERFVKGQHSTGRGLGLAFVNAILQAHGGGVAIADRRGGGTVISVTLPVARGATAGRTQHEKHRYTLPYNLTGRLPEEAMCPPDRDDN